MTVAAFLSSGCCSNAPSVEQMLSSIGGQLCAIQTLLKNNSIIPIPSNVCLEVTTAGAWGAVGDLIQLVSWVDKAQFPPSSIVTSYINLSTGSLVTGVVVSPTSGFNVAPCS